MTQFITRDHCGAGLVAGMEASGMVIATVALMTLLCPWVAVFGWNLTHNEQSIAV